MLKRERDITYLIYEKKGRRIYYIKEGTAKDVPYRVQKRAQKRAQRRVQLFDSLF